MWWNELIMYVCVHIVISKEYTYVHIVGNR